MNILQFKLIRSKPLVLHQHLKWFLLIACLYSLTSCKEIEQYSREMNLQSWKYADVRALDSLDEVEPRQDLMAIYSRLTDKSVQLRIDFLEMPIAREQDIYILFDTNPGGISKVMTNSNQDFSAGFDWDYLIKIPGLGNVTICNDQYLSIKGMALLVMRDPSLDGLILNFNKNTLPISISRTFLQIVVTLPSTNQILDKSDVFSIDAPSPASGKVLFSFWNTFSSATPAQALRSWAGAHSGPMSSRHGLKYLLEAADQTNTPIFLADLFTADHLSALDYLDALPFINNLISKGIIYSPKYKIDKKNNISLVLLKNDKVLFNSNMDFIGVNDYAKFIEYSPCLNVSHMVTNIQSEDILLVCKKLLLINASSPPSLPMIVGGDFTESLLGDPKISIELFSYIDTHPWIQVIADLREAILQSSITIANHKSANGEGYSEVSTGYTSDSPDIFVEINQSLDQLPDNKVKDLANYIYNSLTQPSSDALRDISINYLGQIGFLIKAAEWVNNPMDIESCDSDLDYDGQNECILANLNIFVSIEPNGGYIPFVFSMDTLGAHQVIGPTWEFLVGISDSTEWNILNGLHSDPGQVLGAFSDSVSQWGKYNYIVEESKIILSNVDMSMRKTVSISQDMLRVEIRGTTGTKGYYYIPLVIDPWFRYHPGWGDQYFGEKSINTYDWGIVSREMVKIISTTQLQGYAFNDTHSIIKNDENPNFDYSRGHYLPFPMSLVEIKATDDFSVEILLSP
jgi:hypothetical protein